MGSQDVSPISSAFGQFEQSWMDGALESDIGFILAAIEGSALEPVPSSVEQANTQRGDSRCQEILMVETTQHGVRSHGNIFA
jgi:hypothetical protein